MSLQYLTDAAGVHTAVLIPIAEWEQMTQKHQDLKLLEPQQTKPKTKLSELAGKLSYQTADAMLSHVSESRNEWDDRLEKQL